MLYKEFEVNGKTYKAVLNAAASIQAEQKLGENPLNVVIQMAADGENNKMPSLNSMLVILHASLQKYQHGLKFEDVCDLYDDYIDEGHEMAEMIALIIEIFQVSGYFKKQEDEKKGKGKSNSKN